MRKSDFTEEDIKKVTYGRSETENIINAEERMYKKSNDKNRSPYIMSDTQKKAYTITNSVIKELLDTLLKDVNMFEAQYIITQSVTDYFLDRLIGISEGDIDLLNPENNR